MECPKIELETNSDACNWTKEVKGGPRDAEKDRSELPQILFITSSLYKYNAFRGFLGVPVKLVSLEMEEIQGSKDEIIMDKLQKVRHLVTKSNFVFVDDTSIHMDGLGGFPGQYAKDFLKIGIPKVLEIASKVGGGCVYSTIIGVMHMEEEKIVSKLFSGEVTGSIIQREGFESNEFKDFFLPKKEECEGIPSSIGRVNIGRYKAVEKAKKYLIGIGVYGLLGGN
ncbi:Ham1 nucleotide triphosphosphatase [Encephalitozoon intestinalis ATCC 50506]|uniref:Ham1 nucleotide triphosphosphatase n=1 Tax=Encephalitozoon intestinalis (strain ATCC 50506) TaxID=876142 RepID=E0S7A9_ENCIT|nr:Ham1 nucleotide triphosphosphatase [Encephalitozoon intestinalis ATCC 50506]ADM11537.1 Ham1 nucleotide triphosphosphatase [Encephalitozoon intestinalis ATCC 50506]UTX45251.1 Ham1 nucleotide triphosphosphatase [Encephalitozoon intestinalis]